MWLANSRRILLVYMIKKQGHEVPPLWDASDEPYAVKKLSHSRK